MASGMPTTANIASITSVSSAWAYVKNQCTYYAAQATNWIPAGLGNAADWLHNAQLKGYGTTKTPTVGSVVVYGRGNGYDPANGHVAVVESVAADLKSFTVGEQNFDERGGVQHGRVSTMSDVLGFILAPGQAATGTPGGMPAGNANLNPLDAIGAGFKAIGDALSKAAYIFVGVILFGFGLFLLMRSEGVKAPVPSPVPALKVLKGGRPSAPAPAKRPDVPVKVHGGKDFTIKRGA